VTAAWSPSSSVRRLRQRAPARTHERPSRAGFRATCRSTCAQLSPPGPSLKAALLPEPYCDDDEHPSPAERLEQSASIAPAPTRTTSPGPDPPVEASGLRFVIDETPPIAHARLSQHSSIALEMLPLVELWQSNRSARSMCGFGRRRKKVRAPHKFLPQRGEQRLPPANNRDPKPKPAEKLDMRRRPFGGGCVKLVALARLWYPRKSLRRLFPRPSCLPRAQINWIPWKLATCVRPLTASGYPCGAQCMK